MGGRRKKGSSISEFRNQRHPQSAWLDYAATVIPSVILAAAIGYGLRCCPLIYAGLALKMVFGLAVEFGMASIAIMNIINNAIMLVISRTMKAGLR